MKLTMYPVSINGNAVAVNEFGYVLKRGGSGFNPEGVDSIQFRCRGGRNQICAVDLTLGEQQECGEGGRRRWHWDGNMEAPTITPSIGCDSRCGWHGNIVKGEITP